MGFRDPQALWLLFLIAALLLARRRQPRARTAVGNIYLWREVSPTSATRLIARLRRNWLLLLQIAFVTAAVIALARPMLTVSDDRVVLILDVSASMGARDGETQRLDIAKARAISIAETLSGSAHVRLIAAGAAPRTVGDYAAADPRLASAIRSLELTAESSDIAAAIRATAAAEELPTAIHVISDATPAARTQTALSPKTGVQWVKVGRAADNAAILQLVARRLPSSPARGQVLVEIKNYGTRALNTAVEISVDQEVAARLPVRLDAGAGITHVADVSPLEGIVTARLLTDDALPIDNIRFAVVPPIDSTRILLAGNSFFLEKALSVNPRLTVERNSAQALAAQDDRHRLAAYDVIVCDRCAAPSDAQLPLLIVAPAGARGTAPAGLSISAPDHPVVAGLDLTGIAAVGMVSRAPGHIENVIARVGDEPAILAYEQKGVRVIELRIDPADADLPLSPAFPVLISNAIDWLTARGENPLQVRAGESVTWLLRRAPAAAVEIVSPDNRPLAASVFENHLTVADTHAAGVYRIRGGGANDWFAVNPATDGESDLTERTADVADALITASSVDPRRETFSVFLVLALSLLAAEWWYRLHSVRRT